MQMLLRLVAWGVLPVRKHYFSRPLNPLEERGGKGVGGGERGRRRGEGVFINGTKAAAAYISSRQNFL